MTTLGTVLVHGSYHGAWCWDLVAPLLDGPTIAIDLPGRGARPFADRQVTLADCVTTVLEEADAAGFERFVLVGHSLGGLTVTSTAHAAPDRVAHGVYLAALAPPVGVNTRQLFRMEEGYPSDPTALIAVPPVEVTHAMFAGDLTLEEWAPYHDRCVPEANGLFLDTLAGYDHSVPATYVRCVRDAGVVPELAELGITTLQPDEVVDLDSDHDLMLSHPAETAAVINRIVVAAS